MAFTPGPYHMELVSGSYLDLSAPDFSIITLEDVATGLSNTCRYGGQTKFYSVAEHAVLVSIRLMVLGASVNVQMAGLNHDNGEAFVGDNIRPLKRLIPALSLLEKEIFTAVCEALCITNLPFDDPVVKEADDWALSAEAYHLMPSKGASWYCAEFYDPEDITTPNLWGIAPEQAKSLWLDRYIHLERIIR